MLKGLCANLVLLLVVSICVCLGIDSFASGKKTAPKNEQPLPSETKAIEAKVTESADQKPEKKEKSAPTKKPTTDSIVITPDKVKVGEEQTPAPEAKTEVSNAKYDDIALFGRVINFVEKQYVDPVKSKELVYGAIKGMLEALDPHSNFMPPEIYNQLKVETSGKFGGLGIEVWVNKDGVLTIISPMEGTPAWKAGIKPGDRIVKINGNRTKGMSIVEATAQIRGEVGSPIEFTIQREGAPNLLEFKMKRVMIDVKSVRYELLGDGYGYIKINQFQEKTASEVKAALKKMEEKQKLTGLILDLRNDPGGLLDESVETANLFIDDGVIVSTIGRDKDQKEVRQAKSGIARTDFPIVVLVNGSSASAAEILAGALKDHKRAMIVGTRTFGKGSVQTVIPLGDDVGLKLTIARYYTPSGVSIQAKGIEPDISLEDLDWETYQSMKKKSKFLSEADLKNHIEDDPAKEKSAKEEKGVKVPKEMAPRSFNVHEDYLVQQGLGFLRSMGYAKALEESNKKTIEHGASN